MTSKTIVPPVDAAGFVLLRDRSAGIEVLLGRRHAKSSFLPEYYVFPGGRVDSGDARVRDLDLAPGVALHLGRATRRPPRAFVQAAIRETAEETGLRFPPELAHRIDYVCQALTPTYSPRRYNTRFLLGEGDACEETLRSNGELDDLAWRPVTGLDRLTMLDITRIVLKEALDRWQRHLQPGAEPPLRVTYAGDTPRFARIVPGPR
ncbi:MAG TPA: NUDIX hydrolase [Dongiaceae bacterium]|nr:NUDIX hydrolase [Dongiaceae bacterium]